LEEAQSTLKKVKKPTDITDKYYGFAKRKSGEAEVYITKGNGKVIVNG
jgi:ribosomal protein S9